MFVPSLLPCCIPEYYRQGLHRRACVGILTLGGIRCISGELFTLLCLGLFIIFLPSFITCLWVPLISVPGFGPKVPGAGAPQGHSGPEARAPNGWSSRVDAGGPSDHMI